MSEVNITYEKDVSHCEVSTYVKVVTIDKIVPAINSDNLDYISFKEIGWNVVSQKGLHFEGERVLYIPPDSILPFELSELTEVTKYLNKGKVRAIRLRGNRSEGLILDQEKVEPYLPYIMKWEDPPTVAMRGQSAPSKDVPSYFCKFYHMPNILNEPFTFGKGEPIYYSEKIHGTNFRFGRLKNPQTEEYMDYVGSHNIVIKDDEETFNNNIYWKIFRQFFKGKIPEDIVFFGEIFGPGIQHLTYDVKEVSVKLFHAMKYGDYLNIKIVKELCDFYDLPYVNFHETTFQSIEDIRNLSTLPSEYTTKHGREGVVLVSYEFPERMAKCISFEYLAGEKAKKKRTERH